MKNMTSKEQALELVNKFKLEPIKPFSIMHPEHIKQCALIAVDEIIEEVREFCDDNFINDRLHYWEVVKNEIEKL